VSPAALAKNDVLDFDGPKFKFVAGEFVKYLKEAAQNVLRDEETVQRLLREFRDIFGVNDEALRRATKRIGTQKG
jgi:hypothetical protein